MHQLLAKFDQFWNISENVMYIFTSVCVYLAFMLLCINAFLTEINKTTILYKAIHLVKNSDTTN